MHMKLHTFIHSDTRISLNSILISVFGVYYIIIVKQLSFLVPVFRAYEMSCGGRN